MTLVAAMNMGNYLLMGTDSQGEQVGLTMMVPKLQTLDAMPIAWAFSGEREVGEDFSKWLRGYTWNEGLNWEQFRGEAKRELNRLNKAKRASIRASGIRVNKKTDMTNVLIAGYIANVPQILEITERGESYFHLERGFAAIGSGQNHALIVKNTLEAYWQTFQSQPFRFSDREFSFLIALAANLAPQCSPPPQICALTPQGIIKPQATQSNSKHGQSDQKPSRESVS